MSMLDLSVEMLLSNPPEIVANWCNQYGGTTCKDGSKNSKKDDDGPLKLKGVGEKKTKSKDDGPIKLKNIGKAKKVKGDDGPIKLKSDTAMLHDAAGNLARSIITKGKTTPEHLAEHKRIMGDLRSSTGTMKRAELVEAAKQMGFRVTSSHSAEHVRDLIHKAVGDRIGSAMRSNL